MTYAAKTTVPSGQSKVEIEATVARYGATDYGYMVSPDRAAVAFAIDGRQVRITIPLPDRRDRAFTHHSRGARTASAAAEQYEQAVRQKWRALNLVVKAKLEAIEAGIATFEEEFYAYLVLPDGQTIWEQTNVQYHAALARSDRSFQLSLEA